MEDIVTDDALYAGCLGFAFVYDMGSYLLATDDHGRRRAGFDRESDEGC